MVNIYMLFDEVIKHPVYVGATVNMESRLLGHRSTKFKGYKNKLSIQLLNSVDVKDASKEEEFWYWQLKSFGFNLNQSPLNWYPDKVHTYKEYDTVKMATDIMDAVRYQKSQTGVPVSVFITQAVIEKLEKQVKDKPTKKQ